MPTTYLLLRNNKQTGPHSLDELLHLPLQAQDLIWVEGRSAGWRYPAEIDTLKSYVAEQPKTVQPAFTATTTTQEPPVTTASAPATLRNHTHIFVSLPAGRTGIEEAPPAAALEAKAEALYQRVQAFAQGQPADEIDTRYARSLDDMKQEYGAWLVQQQKKKKYGGAKKKLLIATSVLVVTTSGFGVSKWIRYKTISKEPMATYTVGTLTGTAKKESTTVSLPENSHTITTSTQPPAVQNNTFLQETALQKTTVNPAVTTKKKVAPKQSSPVSLRTDTTTIIQSTVPLAEPKMPIKEEVKKVVPLSRLVTVNSTIQYDTEETNIRTTNVTLQNNSTETLKSVAVMITYLKKEEKPLHKETVYFYNVPPSGTPVLSVAPKSRRAVAARVEIGTITRADGSLYLIH